MLLDRNRMLRLRRLGTVPRWNVVNTVRKQSVGEHTFQVTWIALWLGQLCGAQLDEARVLRACLAHDEEEAISGDVSPPYKRALGASAKDFTRKRKLGYHAEPLLTSDEVNLIAIADKLEALLFIYEEELMGNRTLDGVRLDICNVFEDLWQYFQWDVENGPRPTAPGFIDFFLTQVSPSAHPALARDD